MNRLLMSGLIALLPWIALALSEQEQRDFADGLYSRQMNELALKEYRALMDEFPEHAERDVVWFRMGEASRALGNIGQALGFYNQIILGGQPGPYASRAFLRKAQIMLDADRPGVAREVLDGMLKQQHDEELTAAAWYYRGLACKQQGAEAAVEAERSFRQVADQFAASAYASYASLELANLLRGRPGSEEELLRYYRTAAEQAASEGIGAQALLAMADVLFRQQKFERSAEAFNRLLTKYPNSNQAAVARLNASWANHNAGNFRGALDLIQSVGADHKRAQLVDWMYLEANCLRQLDRVREALLVYRGVIREFGDSEQGRRARYEGALLSYQRQQYQDAIEFGEPLVVQQGLRTEALWIVAESHKALQQFESAARYFRMIVDNPEDATRAPEALFNLARMEQEQERFAQAGDGYVAFVERFGEHQLAPQALFTAGYCASRAQDVEAAVARWRRVVEGWPQHELADDSWYQIGIATMGQQKWVQAGEAFGKAVAIEPASPHRAESAFWLGVLAEREERAEEAEKFYRLALEGGAIDPGHRSKARYRLALLLQQRGAEPQAAEFVQAVLRDDAEAEWHPDVLEWAARYRLEQQQAPEALAAATRLSEGAFSASKQQIGWVLRARAEELAGRQDAARDAYHRAIKAEAQTREGAEAALWLGDYQLQAQAFDDAQQLYASAGDIASGLEQADLQMRSYFGLAATAEGQEDLDTATRFFMTVAVLFEDQELVPEALFRAWRGFGTLGKESEQKKAATELRERFPDSPWVGRLGG